jgi:hypothetical protein
MVREPALQLVLQSTPTARLRLLLPPGPLQKQLRLLPKRPRLDLCAMHNIKNTAMQKLPMNRVWPNSSLSNCRQL